MIIYLIEMMTQKWGKSVNEVPYWRGLGEGLMYLVLPLFCRETYLGFESVALRLQQDNLTITPRPPFGNDVNKTHYMKHL